MRSCIRIIRDYLQGQLTFVFDLNKSVEAYFTHGCGRCPLGGTPDCKVHLWTEELKALRQIILRTDLEEESKWGAVCYTYNGKNVLMLSALKNYCCISFFKGSLLADRHKLLSKPGPNSQAARLLKCTSIEDVKKLEEFIPVYICLLYTSDAADD